LSCFSLFVFSNLFEEEEERDIKGVVVISSVNNNEVNPIFRMFGRHSTTCDEISTSSGYH
jgi:hypothetical protein